MDDSSLLPDTGGCVISIPLHDVEGETFAFVALEDGTLIIEDQEGEASLESLATVVERRVAPAYRARGFRFDGKRWIVVADPIDVSDFGALAGETLTAVALGDEHRVTLDGKTLSPSQVPDELRLELEDGAPCILSASHIDEQWWEVTIEELPHELAHDPAADSADPAAP